ncbi:hypothetical protein C0J52_28219 [Blattella germanica]|nr:hypothetical protein C0J52_28219 [Blattella germanica]
MPVDNSPISLEMQCIHRIGTLVSEKFSICLQSVKNKPMRKIEAECRKLKDFIHKGIPFVVANSVTQHLLRKLDDSPAYSRELMTSNSEKKIIRTFVHIALHPETTVLEITWHWRYVGDVVHFVMGHLSELKTFKIIQTECFDGENVMFSAAKCLHSFMNLEHLTLQGKCTDELLHVISTKCTKLKHFDICGSELVSDRSIDFIVRFKDLQTLDVTHTGLSDDGRTQILIRLSENENKSLKSYACNHISNSEMSVLVNRFPNLITLSVRFVNINICLDRLQGLNHLEVFKTDNYMQHFHTPLIEIVGKNLVELQLVGYKLIADVLANCPHLVTLSLKMDSIQFEQEMSLSFPKLKNLTLVTNEAPGTALFLTCCPNLVSLQLITVPEFYTKFHFEMLVRKNPLHYLKRLAVGSLSGDLPISAVDFILKYWKLLSYKILLSKSKKNENFKTYPGVQIDCDLWMNITQSVHFFSDIRRKPKRQNYTLMTRLYQYTKAEQ